MIWLDSGAPDEPIKVGVMAGGGEGSWQVYVGEALQGGPAGCWAQGTCGFFDFDRCGF